VIGFRRFSIPITILPQIWDLLSSLSALQSSGKAWCRPGQKAIFSRGSTWGIAEAVRTLLKSRNKNRGIVFLPDYFCNHALIPLRLQQVQLVFYPITENLNPDWSLLNDLVSQYGSPDMFILVHYFGFPAEITKVIQFCRQVGAELLEDAAHVLIPFGDIGKHSWGTVFSPYKLLPVPKIGILVTSENREIIHETYDKKKRVDINTWKWIGKRLLQSFLTHYKISWRSQKVIPFELDTEARFEENSPVNILSLQLLKILESKLESYKTTRRMYYKNVEEQILSINNDVASPLFPSLPEGVCPYLFPIRLDQNIIEYVYYRLNAVGIPAQMWPALPAEVKEKPFGHKIAIKLRESILTIPIHQSLTKHHIECIVSNLRDAIRESLQTK